MCCSVVGYNRLDMTIVIVCKTIKIGLDMSVLGLHECHLAVNFQLQIEIPAVRHSVRQSATRNC